jgi:hypothetical protein
MAFDKAMSCAFVFVSVFVLFGDKAAADDLSCQDRIVSLGNSAYEVQALCGPPDAIQQRVESRTVQRPVSVPCGRRGLERCVVLVADSVDVTVEEWTYDFGHMRFLQFLTFEQGKLIAIHAGNYGHKAT